jgi:N-acyl-D-aspartate/D-glutamate deacylase
VTAGRISDIGRIEGKAAAVIDAAGRVVCPGFIDPHTHYDPQITWDSLLSSSSEHLYRKRWMLEFARFRLPYCD